MSGKTLGEMTSVERYAAARRAALRLQSELRKNAAALGEVLDEHHETYVYGPTKGRYQWRCLTCDTVGDPAGFRRRMDADTEAADHECAHPTPPADSEADQ